MPSVSHVVRVELHIHVRLCPLHLEPSVEVRLDGIQRKGVVLQCISSVGKVGIHVQLGSDAGTVEEGDTVHAVGHSLCLSLQLKGGTFAREVAPAAQVQSLDLGIHLALAVIVDEVHVVQLHTLEFDTEGIAPGRRLLRGGTVGLHHVPVRASVGKDDGMEPGVFYVDAGDIVSAVAEE